VDRQIGDGVVEFCGAAGNVGEAKLAFEPVKPTGRAISPKFGHFDRNGGDVLALVCGLIAWLLVVGHDHWGGGWLVVDRNRVRE
jgi:hypothetical protein